MKSKNDTTLVDIIKKRKNISIRRMWVLKAIR